MPQGSFLSLIQYLFFNTNLIEIANKYKCILSTRFIDDIIFAIARKSSAINNEILIETHEEVLN